MIKDVTDRQGAICGDTFVPITIGIELSDLGKPDSPSAQRLLKLAEHFSSRSVFNTFVQAFTTQPTGSVGCLEW